MQIVDWLESNMQKLLFLFISCGLILSCSNNHKKTIKNISDENLKYFTDFKIIDSLCLELGNIEENWNSVIDACLETLDKRILFLDSSGGVFEDYPNNTCIVKTNSGKTFFVEDALNTVIYSTEPVHDDFDEYRYFDIFCHDFEKINYGGDVSSQIVDKPSEKEVLRIIEVKRRVLRNLLPPKKEIEYVFFVKKKENILLYDYLFECPSKFDAFPFLELWK